MSDTWCREAPLEGCSSCLSLIRPDLVDALGYWESQTPINGPYPRFEADSLDDVEAWLHAHGYGVTRLRVPPGAPVLAANPAAAAVPDEFADVPSPRDLAALQDVCPQISETVQGIDWRTAAKLAQRGSLVALNGRRITLEILGRPPLGLRFKNRE